MKKIFKFDNNPPVQELLSLEWLETNGIGGYASSTVINCHTRKYHGLLVAKLQNPPGKFVLLSKIEDSILLGKDEFFMTSHKYPGVIHPKDFMDLTEFRAKEVPAFHYRFEKTPIIKEVLLVQKEDTLLIKYSGMKKNLTGTLRIKPLLACRDFHALSHENSSVQSRTSPCKNGFSITPYLTMPPLFFQSNKDFQFQQSPDWYRDFEYTEEQARGFDFHEDLFMPGIIEIDFKGGEEVIISASTREQGESLIRKWNREISRRKKRNKIFTGSSFQKTLMQAADQFIVEDSEGKKAVIAGYPWFLAWGRDAMIALPGLTLYSGREKDCLNILRTFAENEKKGLIPNFIGDSPGKNAYNSADASLWFGWAVQKYLEKTKDRKSVKKFLWPTLKKIFLHYKSGTLFNIKMLDNGLLRAGDEYSQVTWMDASVYGKPVTPREGCPVEINALWYNLVCFIDELGDLFHDEITEETESLMEQIYTSFNRHFPIKGKNYLADVVKENGEQDTSLRPNQIFAVSLPYSPLSIDMARSVIKIVQKELLTPRGLRTLSPSDQKYCRRYEGEGTKRDSAYHNGTVWPWLMGHFGEALLKSTSEKKKASLMIEGFLKNFEDHFEEAGLFMVSEIFDADPPHNPHGCISQAWSVAELLRLSHLIKKA